jgi:FMN phosphatase YigB (HAD superfamily)
VRPVEPTTAAFAALLLDIGNVIIDINWPAIEAFEAATGADVRGPYTGDGRDELWQQRVSGSLAADDYWRHVAERAGYSSTPALARALAPVVPDLMLDEGAVTLMRDARDASKRVGVLSNDAYDFLGRDFFANRPEFAALDAFVDASELGTRKPAAEAYRHAAKALGVEPNHVVYLDDTPEMVDGAIDVGMTAIHVDTLDRRPAFALARQLLGLDPGLFA